MNILQQRLEELHLRILPSRFHFLKFILEGYDNLAILSAGISTGHVVIRYPRAMTDELFALVSSIAPSINGTAFSKIKGNKDCI
jgi:hypothetical protein